MALPCCIFYQFSTGFPQQESSRTPHLKYQLACTIAQEAETQLKHLFILMFTFTIRLSSQVSSTSVQSSNFLIFWSLSSQKLEKLWSLLGTELASTEKKITNLIQNGQCLLN